MKRCTLLVIALTALLSYTLHAHADKPSFPDKDWHKGFYVLLTGGMMQVTDDKNVQTGRTFDGSFVPALGFTFGYDFLDWLGIMVQGSSSFFATDQVGTGTSTAPYENAREVVMNGGVFARFTFLTHWNNQPSGVRILPYAKAGAGFRMLWVLASYNNNIFGFGTGPSVGGGIEFLVMDKIFFGLDVTENLMFMKGDFNKGIKLMDGGFKPNFQVLGMVGYHF